MTNSKIYYSVTELETYARSPREYFLKYVLKSPATLGELKTGLGRVAGRGLPANVHGDMVHNLIERNIPLEHLSLEMGLDISSDESAEIKAQFKNYCDSKYAGIKDARHELPFLMRVSGVYIKGKLDMLIPDWEIVDFKTGGEKDPNEAAKKYDLQLRTYALAVAKSGQYKRTGRVTLLFLSDKGITPISKEIDEDILKKTYDELEGIIGEISAGTTLQTFFPSSPAPLCSGRKGR